MKVFMRDVISFGNIKFTDFLKIDSTNLPDDEEFQIHFRDGMTNAHTFKIIHKDALDRWALGRYHVEEAAEFISEYSNVDFNTINNKLLNAALNHKINCYMPGQNIIFDGNQILDYHQDIYWDDLNKWLDDNEKRITWRFEKPSNIRQPIHKAAKGLSKNSIIVIFDGLYWKSDQWKRNLGDVPKWLECALVLKGSRPKRVSHTWNPVLIGIALIESQNIDLRKLDKVFKSLDDWNEEWQEKTEFYR